MHWFGLFFIAAGLFSLCGAVCDWEWFMTHRKASFFVSVFGRIGARIFYALFGAGLAILGVLFLTGVIAERR